MRRITSRYAGECTRCATAYAVGDQIVYSRSTGTFCVGCEPTDPEEIRAYRQAKIDRKNGRREQWAQARERRAAAAQTHSDRLMSRDPETGRADWALVTQPGHIPQRAAALRAQEKAWEEQRAADQHRARKLGPAIVAGDRERRRQAERDALRPLIQARVGTVVKCHPYGDVKLIRVNSKSVTVETARGFRDRVCLTWVYLTPEGR